MVRRGRVVVAMSGGVDSSLAAALLVESGYDVIGVSMRLWEADAMSESGCCSLDDFLDARRVADQLAIPFYVMDFRDDFRRSVVEPFVADYRSGRTPNPCARCNQFVKFAVLWERARALGADWIASGHYARRHDGRQGAELWRAVDTDKDQSYFLFGIGREMLQRALFPIGELTKARVREEAERRGLAVARKPDSQEVCFAPRGAYAAFVERFPSTLPLRGGAVTDSDGAVLARHEGIHRFTVGQRHGLGVGQGAEPRYVTGIDADTAVVRVGSRAQVTRDILVAGGANWLGPRPHPGATLSIKIRSRYAPQPVLVTAAGATKFEIRAAGGLQAPAPGQAAVLYDGERVLGGGWIERTGLSTRASEQAGKAPPA
jgi:tRNA-specific 2-thiouridylase